MLYSVFELSYKQYETADLMATCERVINSAKAFPNGPAVALIILIKGQTMQVSTIHNGILITGVVVKHTASFLEVAITSPFSKLSTSRHLPASFRKVTGCVGSALESECSSLLVELYEVANRSLNRKALPS